MRRVAWLLIGLGVVIAIAPAALGDSSGTYADRFDAQSYSGSNGTLEWKGPWVEVGESNGPAAGSVRVESDTGCSSGRCLKITSQLLELDQAGAARFADTSAFTTATLSFQMASETLGLGGLVGALSGASLTVEVTTNSGASWSVLYRGNLADLLGGGTAKVLSLDSYLGAGFGVRFLAQDLLGGEALIDNVEVLGLQAVTTTTVTTTTTNPVLPIPTITIPLPTDPTIVPPPPTLPSPTTTAPRPTTTHADPSRDSTTTTTTTTNVTTTTPSAVVIPGSPDGPDGGPAPDEGASGLRISESGVQTDADGFTFRAVDLAGGHRSAAERITSEWLSLAGLAMVVTGVSVFGVDRRRRNVADESSRAS